MVRKSASAKSVKASSSSIFDVKFEVVLIIILIVVAILLVCFINRKFSREQFYVSMIKEHMYAEGSAPSSPNQNQNQNQNQKKNQPNDYGGYDLTGSNLPSSLSDFKGKHVFILLAPTWCGHSKNFIDNGTLKEFIKNLTRKNKGNYLHALDIDIKNSPLIDEIKSKVKVEAVPSAFYLDENGKLAKGKLDIGDALNFLSE